MKLRQRPAKRWNRLVLPRPHLLALTRILGFMNIGPLFDKHLLNSVLINLQILGPHKLRRLTLHLPPLVVRCGPQRAKVNERVGMLTLGTIPILQCVVTTRKLWNLLPAQELLPVASFGKCLSLRWKVVHAPP